MYVIKIKDPTGEFFVSQTQGQYCHAKAGARLFTDRNEAESVADAVRPEWVVVRVPVMVEEV